MIHAQVCENGWNAKKNSFVQYYGSDQLDASLLMLARVGFLPPTDPRIIGTVEAIQRELVHDGLVMRYDVFGKQVDGLPDRLDRARTRLNVVPWPNEVTSPSRGSGFVRPLAATGSMSGSLDATYS